jgi:hypothetical protein
VHEEDRASKNFLYSMKLAVVNAFLYSPATAPENSLDETKQVCQVGTRSQSIVARVNFPHEGISG